MVGNDATLGSRCGNRVVTAYHEHKQQIDTPEREVKINVISSQFRPKLKSSGDNDNCATNDVHGGKNRPFCELGLNLGRSQYTGLKGDRV